MAKQEETETNAKTVVDTKTASENLATFSVDRDDIMQVLGALPDIPEINRVTVEYELQLLKILTVGWSISYHMNKASKKEEIGELFWHLIRDFSRNISEMTETTTGTNVDYFETVKERFNYYLSALEGASGGDPAALVGPRFSEMCKSGDNVFVIMAGARIFNASVAAVKEYLDAVEIA